VLKAPYIFKLMFSVTLAFAQIEQSAAFSNEGEKKSGVAAKDKRQMDFSISSQM